MRRIILHLTCLTALAAPLMLGLPALAQSDMAQPGPGSAAPPPMIGGTPPAGAPGMTPPAPLSADMRMERREFREEREQIRGEHERIEAETDQLKTDCANAQGQQHDDCETRRRNLQGEKAALHTRMQSLHDRMAAAGVPMPNHRGGMQPMPGAGMPPQGGMMSGQQPAQPMPMQPPVAPVGGAPMQGQ